MTKKVIIDGIEYVPKADTEAAPPKIIGFSVDYGVLTCGSRCVTDSRYLVGATFEIVSISGERSSVYLTAKYAEELLEAIRK